MIWMIGRQDAEGNTLNLVGPSKSLAVEVESTEKVSRMTRHSEDRICMRIRDTKDQDSLHDVTRRRESGGENER